ncbi:MAG TPA: 2-amino-4-hydroxy-6-hydroxymethyldihydropteridine diphosphokinase [Syntrophomonadaceae bacterium]|nr:2-amino-4-hydroxy-6-hydroxymethyldihydropteridine diphosphokinase [Syntrophomonadaceae bacterium]HNX28841.1 2-amino-4-hydroxy-6-hydroxymethyldihydropteridine diphosphokinase [Syntrophomonadaceae bacterium]HPR93291.1 2-amino-4-hydroxy-6-hydroxymethyldihydropteridine diphosphokinase [Syntrophomonadaceae bacterium]
MQTITYLSLGSNIGFKRQNIERAVKLIGEIDGISVTKISSFYETEPWGKKDQENFINAAVEIVTDISPVRLLKELQKIEIKMGRQQLEKWGPRIIDIDILLFGDEVLDGPELTVPHPYMRERLFVLIPLEEINSAIRFPDDGMDIKEVLTRVIAREGNQKIIKI